MDGDDREQTAFTTGSGLHQFTLMPFSLCNAPATFERLMERVLILAYPGGCASCNYMTSSTTLRAHTDATFGVRPFTRSGPVGGAQEVSPPSESGGVLRSCNERPRRINGSKASGSRTQLSDTTIA